MMQRERVATSSSRIRRRGFVARRYDSVRMVVSDLWASILGRVGLLIVLLLLVLLVVFPLFWPIEPYRPDENHTLHAPSLQYPFGTDELGRDLLSRVVAGARHSLLVVLLAVGAGAVTGMLVAFAAGYWGGVVDRVVMRFIDLVLAFPDLIIGISAAMVLGTGTTAAGVAVALMVLPQVARQARAATLKEKEREYVRAARGLGLGSWRQLAEILPNALPPVLVTVIVLIPEGLILEATLSFLGLGEHPPAPSLGAMVNTSRNFALDAPWYAIASGAVLSFIILCVSLIGLAYTDRLSGGAVVRRGTLLSQRFGNSGGSQ